MKRWLLLVCVLGACRPDDQTTESIKRGTVRAARAEPAPELVAHLDSGNAAYRSKDFSRAIEHYRAALRIDDDHAAPWFGIYMAERALGNAAAADSALKRAQKIAPGASLIQPRSETR